MLINKKNLISKYWFIILIALMYSLIPLFNLGYYHADEHFQIIEFSGLKLGFNEKHHLTWEFHNQIRSSIQPFISYVIISICNLFNILSPYIKLTILKLITSLLSIFIITYFIKIPLFSNKMKFRLKVLFLIIWFIPLISSRFSSETWGGLFSLLSVSFYFHSKLKYNSTTRYLILGCIMGLSFLFRFQIAFLLVGFITWLLVIEKIKFKDFLFIVLGGTFIISIGVVLDLWLYNEFTFSAWNYFYSNIIESKAASFGEEPILYYFSKIVNLPISGYFIIILFPFLLIKHFKSIYSWLIFSFIIGHMLVGHKEFRFIFPLAYFVPIIIVYFIEYVESFPFVIPSYINKLIVTVFLLLNFSVYSIILLKGEDDNGRYRISKYLYDNYSGDDIDLISLPYSSPYNTFGALANFYNTARINKIYVNNLCEVVLDEKHTSKNTFIIYRKVEDSLNKNCNNISEFDFIMQSTPSYVEFLIVTFYDKTYSDNVLKLYKTKSKCIVSKKA